MMRILKRSLISACVCEAIAFLLVVTGTTRDDDLIGLTFLGRVGHVLHRPGMAVEDHVSGDFMNWVALVGTPLILWFMLWVVLWFAVSQLKRKGSPNQAVEATS